MLIPVIRIHISVLDDGHLRAQTKSLRKECLRTRGRVDPYSVRSPARAPSRSDDYAALCILKPTNERNPRVGLI